MYWATCLLHTGEFTYRWIYSHNLVAQCYKLPDVCPKNSPIVSLHKTTIIQVPPSSKLAFLAIYSATSLAFFTNFYLGDHAILPYYITFFTGWISVGLPWKVCEKLQLYEYPVTEFCLTMLNKYICTSWLLVKYLFIYLILSHPFRLYFPNNLEPRHNTHEIPHKVA